MQLAVHALELASCSASSCRAIACTWSIDTTLEDPGNFKRQWLSQMYDASKKQNGAKQNAIARARAVVENCKRGRASAYRVDLPFEFPMPSLCTFWSTSFSCAK